MGFGVGCRPQVRNRGRSIGVDIPSVKYPRILAYRKSKNKGNLIIYVANSEYEMYYGPLHAYEIGYPDTKNFNKMTAKKLRKEPHPHTKHGGYLEVIKHY